VDLDATVRDLARRLLGYCLLRTGDRGLAEEIAQDCLAALVHRWRRHGRPESPEAFVFAIARRRAARAPLRRRLWLPLDRLHGQRDQTPDIEARLIQRCVSVLIIGLTVPAFGQANKEQAKQVFKQANELSAQQDYANAAAKYEEAIRLDPSLVDAYFPLAKIQEAGLAEQTLISAVRANPQDLRVYEQLAAYYSRLGQFQKAVETYRQWADVDPGNAEPRYSMAAFYWDKAYRDAKLTATEKRDCVTKGMEAVDEALLLKPDYVEALVTRGLLLRVLASFETDRGRYDDLMRQALELSQKAQELQKKKLAEGAIR
jgi:tetratricopeptide (TPR) repeat protein